MTGRIGIDNYGLYPLGLNPKETLQWALDHQAEGVAFSGLDEGSRSKCSPQYLKELAKFATDNNLYLEWGGGQHIPRDLVSWDKKEIFGINKRAAEEANNFGVSIIRSCSGGLMRWNPDSLSTQQLMEEMAEELRSQLQMLRDHEVVLAIETHFEFTSFELLRVFEWCQVTPGDCLGICLDTMNLLTMLEDPVAATERVLPWIVSTHFKDGAIRLTNYGLQSFTCPIGEGIVDLNSIISSLSKLDNKINISIEDHGGDFKIPINNPEFLQEFPDLSTAEMTRIFELAKKSQANMDAGKCHVLDRGEWPQQCEERLRKDIVALRRIVNG